MMSKMNQLLMTQNQMMKHLHQYAIPYRWKMCNLSYREDTCKSPS